MTGTTVIVGYDGSPEARVAATWALDEAARTGASVQFVYAFEWATLVPAASMVPAIAVWPDGEKDTALQEMLRDVVTQAAVTHPGVAVRSVIVHEAAAQALIHRSADARLVVVGSRGHNAVVGLLGSVSVAVSAHARCPVVVVRGDADAQDPVVVGVDDSDAALLALGFAFEQASARGAGLRVIRAWAPPTSSWSGPPVDVDEIATAERVALDEVVAGWRDKFPTVPVTCELTIGYPSRVLTEATANAQLLVVGTRGRGAFRGALLGSVSQNLLHHSACTLAVVRETTAPETAAPETTDPETTAT